MKFEFREFVPVSVSAQIVGESLEAIRQQGSLTPHLVVQAAEVPGHPLHPCFTWDDTEAAKNWRLNEARGLIRSVRIVTDEQESFTAYVSIKTDEGRCYQRSDVAVKTESELTSALRGLQHQMDGVLASIDDLHRLAGDLVMIHKARRSAEVTAERLKRVA